MHSHKYPRQYRSLLKNCKNCMALLTLDSRLSKMRFKKEYKTKNAKETVG
jgi:hypothetical protein